jgi:hypothetical protein
MNNSDRFVWVRDKDVCDEVVGLYVREDGSTLSVYDDLDEGFIYDKQESKKVMDFGNNEAYYPSCGEAPNKQFLDVIMNALNSHDFNKGRG